MGGLLAEEREREREKEKRLKVIFDDYREIELLSHAYKSFVSSASYKKVESLDPIIKEAQPTRPAPLHTSTSKVHHRKDGI